MQSTSHHPYRRLALTGAAVIAGAALLAACSSSGSDDKPARSTSPASTASQSPAAGSGTVGELTFADGWVRQPANPEMAAAYLTIKNNGAADDQLVSVTSDVTTKVVPMDEVTKNGVGGMVDMPKLVVPSKGSFVLSPGHAHLMLYITKGTTLAPGDQVKLTLTFTHNGSVTLTLPVKPRSATDQPMTHMTNMSGMASTSPTGPMG